MPRGREKAKEQLGGVAGKTGLRWSLPGLLPAWVSSSPLGEIHRGLRFSVLAVTRHGIQMGEEDSVQEKFLPNFLSKQGT